VIRVVPIYRKACLDQAKKKKGGKEREEGGGGGGDKIIGGFIRKE
jgi:hypothetical protein